MENRSEDRKKHLARLALIAAGGAAAVASIAGPAVALAAGGEETPAVHAAVAGPTTGPGVTVSSQAKATVASYLSRDSVKVQPDEYIFGQTYGQSDRGFSEWNQRPSVPTVGL